MRDYAVGDASEEAKVTANSAVQVYQWMRDVCSTKLLQHPIKLGGPGVVVQIDDPKPMHLQNTCSEEIEKLCCDLLQAGTHCGLLQVLPVSTQVALQDHIYSSSTVAASTSLTLHHRQQL